MKKKVTQILSIALCMVLLFGSTVTANAAKTSSNTSAYQAVFDAEYYYNSNPDLQAAFGYDAQKLFNHFVSSGIYEEDQAALISMLQFTEPITRIFRQHSAMTLHPTVPIMRQTVQQRKKCNDTDLGWRGSTGSDCPWFLHNKV